MATHSVPLTGQPEALLLPGARPAIVRVQQAKPCVVILIHGVNDLAGVYDDLETGICVGLNERLDHLKSADGSRSCAALNPASYRLPAEDQGAAPNPDAVYYRRRASAGKFGGASRSVVIPFYWGFREEEQYIDKKTEHGEWLDRYHNRLDKDGIKQGGMFANATTSIPDMWGEGFSGKLMGLLPINPLFGSPDHPLVMAPSRKYMLLAARRLAMLVNMIRAYRHPGGKTTGENDTINVVGHSQGTLITLLANALLKDEGKRAVDAVIMMNPPYSLLESRFERMEMSEAQQTTKARVTTLANIVGFIGANPNPVPTFAQMADPSSPSCIGGLRWNGLQCQTTLEGKDVAFSERDNRGRVFLYFCPEDKTVGMRNVQGIGWQGIADTLTYQARPAHKPRTMVDFVPTMVGNMAKQWVGDIYGPGLSALGGHFHQRVFTMRARDGESQPIGLPPTQDYVLRRQHESTWEGSGMGLPQRWAANADFAPGQSVPINAPALPQPFLADFRSGGVVMAEQASAGIAPVHAPDDPIDASIAITNKGIRVAGTRVVTLPESAGPVPQTYSSRSASMAYAPLLEAELTGLNDPLRNPYTAPENNDWAADWHRITGVDHVGGRRFNVTYQESPNEARRRRMDAGADEQSPISFHSSIPANSMHSQRAMAYDLAIGQARSIDDEPFYAYLCRVADWRMAWVEFDVEPNASKENDAALPDEATLDYYRNESSENLELINATDLYRSRRVAVYDEDGKLLTRGGGSLPASIHQMKLPTLVSTQTRKDRDAGRDLTAGDGEPG
ncbi:hypothetical protein C4E15_10425 [Achromobacter spanius]|uniref:DUF3274 domain-containing protein n=1 Tax=Achromobacter spanius TaxID=217203 RepID=A0A2S5GTB9_9BURK|nr:DUF3274 domain-containing protein [Achromobacter spanius]PPA76091.1 hypothetical protein C4E15_10425 [Achromobacter spanius]